MTLQIQHTENRSSFRAKQRFAFQGLRNSVIGQLSGVGVFICFGVVMIVKCFETLFKKKIETAHCKIG